MSTGRREGGEVDCVHSAHAHAPIGQLAVQLADHLRRFYGSLWRFMARRVPPPLIEKRRCVCTDVHYTKFDKAVEQQRKGRGGTHFYLRVKIH